MKKLKRRSFKETAFFVINIFLPLLIGGSLYYVVFPDVLFVQKIDELLGFGLHVELNIQNIGVLRWCRNYLFDILWSYALTFSLYVIFEDEHGNANLKRILSAVVIFSIGMELLQAFQFVTGTFDAWDIVVEILSECIATLGIKRRILRRKEHGKED